MTRILSCILCKRTDFLLKIMLFFAETEKDLYQMQQHLVIILKLRVLSDLYTMHLNFLQSFLKLQQHLLLSFLPNLSITQQEEWHKALSVHIIHHCGILHFLLRNMRIFLCFCLGLCNTRLPPKSNRILIIFRRKIQCACTNYQLNCTLLILLRHQNERSNFLDPNIY